jgi:hypothetical protein
MKSLQTPNFSYVRFPLNIVLWKNEKVLHSLSNYILWAMDFMLVNILQSRSQWLHGLRHEPSSPARILGSCVRIPLQTWMSACVYSVFVFFCV